VPIRDETDDARLHYFGPHLEADVDYERFLHQLDSKSYPGWTTVPAANGLGFQTTPFTTDTTIFNSFTTIAFVSFENFRYQNYNGRLMMISGTSQSADLRNLPAPRHSVKARAA